MMTLFDVAPHPRHRHLPHDTEHDAAHSITPGRTEQRILETYNASSVGVGMTDDELCDALSDLYAPTVKSARSRLSRDGVLVDSGVRRPSVRGRAQIVWRRA